MGPGAVFGLHRTHEPRGGINANYADRPGVGRMRLLMPWRGHVSRHVRRTTPDATATSDRGRSIRNCSQSPMANASSVQRFLPTAKKRRLCLLRQVGRQTRTFACELQGAESDRAGASGANHRDEIAGRENRRSTSAEDRRWPFQTDMGRSPTPYARRPSMALLSERTAAAAAASAGISERTLRRWLTQDDEFKGRV